MAFALDLPIPSPNYGDTLRSDQLMLKRAGYYAPEPNGLDDSTYRAAIRAFRAYANAPSGGILGPGGMLDDETRGLLFRFLRDGSLPGANTRFTPATSLGVHPSTPSPAASSAPGPTTPTSAPMPTTRPASVPGVTPVPSVTPLPATNATNLSPNTPNTTATPASSAKPNLLAELGMALLLTSPAWATFLYLRYARSRRVSGRQR